MTGPAGAPAAPSTATYILVYRDGVNARAKAAHAGVKPSFVYSHALDGFAANLTPAQRAAIAGDPQALMVLPGHTTSVGRTRGAPRPGQ